MVRTVREANGHYNSVVVLEVDGWGLLSIPRREWEATKLDAAARKSLVRDFFCGSTLVQLLQEMGHNMRRNGCASEDQIKLLDDVDVARQSKECPSYKFLAYL